MVKILSGLDVITFAQGERNPFLFSLFFLLLVFDVIYNRNFF